MSPQKKSMATGHVAIVVTNLTREGATLFRGSKGVFDDVSARFGLTAPTFAFTGFGTQWLDYDNDGRLDLVVANGAVTIVESQRGRRTRTGNAICYSMTKARGRNSVTPATSPARISSA